MPSSASRRLDSSSEHTSSSDISPSSSASDILSHLQPSFWPPRELSEKVRSLSKPERRFHSQIHSFFVHTRARPQYHVMVNTAYKGLTVKPRPLGLLSRCTKHLQDCGSRASCYKLVSRRRGVPGASNGGGVQTDPEPRQQRHWRGNPRHALLHREGIY